MSISSVIVTFESSSPVLVPTSTYFNVERTSTVSPLISLFSVFNTCFVTLIFGFTTSYVLSSGVVVVSTVTWLASIVAFVIFSPKVSTETSNVIVNVCPASNL